METRPIILLAGMLAAAIALADGAYKWTDEDGVVHYSDVPVDNAEIVNLDEYSRNTGARISRDYQTSKNAAPDGTDGPFRYESLSIASPGAEETLWNIEGVLNVRVNVSPRLQEGHRVRVYFDGKPRFVRSTNFEIEEVYRGVHNLQIEVIDATGKLMIRSQTNRFYVHQNTVTSR